MKNAVHDLRADAVYRVELKGVRSKKALLEVLAAGLKLPKHFGHNWDALADCLMDDAWAKTPAITVLLLDSGAASKRFADDWQTLYGILEEAAQWWGERNKPFHVVLA
ncbi:MAG: barstar family protein [Burkholderiales bacterium]|nr:barstar family protein [Burkholderiales bacterium]